MAGEFRQCLVRLSGLPGVQISLWVTFGLLVGLAPSRGAELKPEALRAWKNYLDLENQSISARASDTKCFLWVYENPERCKKVLSGTTVVQPVTEHSPLHVPSGLIHHWVGAIFIPNATPKDILSVTRDYADYSSIYKPGVADAKVISKTKNEDRFTIRFVNDSVISRTSLLGIYVNRIVPIADNRVYSISETLNMQEFKDFGTARQRELPPNHSSGYIWRLFSTARLDQRDGGTIVELEAIALSRDVPTSMRWFVEPLIRRISRDSLEKSLTQTAEAVRIRLQECSHNPQSKADSN